MPIKNYTTEIEPNKTASEIMAILGEYGAQQTSIKFGPDRKVEAVSFVLDLGGIPMEYELTVDIEGMLQAMKKDKKIPNHLCDKQQAERTAWRNRKDWLHLQISEAEANQARLEQLLLGWAITETGENLYQRIKKNNQLQITEGD